MIDTKKRSLVKALSWKVVGSSATWLIAWIITGSFELSNKIGLAQVITTMILYFIHERVWDQIGWARQK